MVEEFGGFWVDLLIWLVFCFLVGWYNIGFLRVGGLGCLLFRALVRLCSVVVLTFVGFGVGIC